MAKRKVAENNRGFKGVWIPSEIWLDENLTVQEMVFLIEIDSLDQKNGCFASNQHFADFFGLSKSRSSEVIKKLEEKGYINIAYLREGKEIKKRIIHVVTKYVGIRETEEGYSEKTEGSNTLLSNTINNNNIESKLSKYFSLTDVNELNKKTSTHISSIIKYYANVYMEYKDKFHPNLKEEQIVKVIDIIETVDITYSMDIEDWQDLIDKYFKGSHGDGNINRFVSGNELEGTIRGLLI